MEGVTVEEGKDDDEGVVLIDDVGPLFNYCLFNDKIILMVVAYVL